MNRILGRVAGSFSSVAHENRMLDAIRNNNIFDV
jgi:hypothetical protein